jgi:hypothetical protein
MPQELINELDDITWRLETIFRTDPKLIRKWKPKVKKLEEAATNVSRVMSLADKWPTVPQSLLLEFATNESAPFIKVCIGLTSRRYQLSPTSLCLWWRRMIASGQQHILTYFSWAGLDRLEVETVCGNDLLRACTDNIALLDNIRSIIADDQSVDFRIRELLGGLSKTSDVKAAWKKWVMTNHPDKGGDPEHFLEVKVVYDEWLTFQKEN